MAATRHDEPFEKETFYTKVGDQICWHQLLQEITCRALMSAYAQYVDLIG